MKICFSALMMVFLVIRALSQESFNQELYRLYISNRMSDWEGPIQKTVTQARLDEDRDLMFDLLLAEYGFIGYCISRDHMDKQESGWKTPMLWQIS